MDQVGIALYFSSILDCRKHRIEIRVGDTVTWENAEKRQYHSVWFESLDAEEPDYIFPGGRLMTSWKWSR